MAVQIFFAARVRIASLTAQHGHRGSPTVGHRSESFGLTPVGLPQCGGNLTGARDLRATPMRVATGAAQGSDHLDGGQAMRWKSSLAAAFLGLVGAGLATAALAFDFGVANAVSAGNLSVYLVRGAGAATAPLTLEQGLAGGLLKIHETDKLPFEVENLSGRSVFIQAGDMLRGGLQDQVAVYDYVIGPHSGRVPIETLCVDPFRSAARTGDSAKLFEKAGGLIPSRAATLALWAQPASDKAVRKLRQSAVWWSIASLRGELSQRLGHALETPRRVSWDESQSDDAWTRAFQQEQRSQWKTSLPLALEDTGLPRIEQPYLEALLAAGHRSGVIGAVFAINGRVEGAEIYQSSGLFRAMWPKLLRAYAIRALVAGPADHAAAPSVADVTAFLDAADAGQPRADAAPGGFGIRESAGSVATQSAGQNGAWVHRGYVAKLAAAEASRSPEAALVAALDTGAIEGIPVTSLDPREPVVPRSNAAHDTPLASRDVSWRVELPDSNRRAMRALADASQLRAEGDEAAARPRLIAAFMAVFAAVLVTMLLLRRVGWLPKISGGAHALIAGARRQSMRIAGWIRSLLARVRRVDRAAGTQAVPVASPALRRSLARLADRRRLRRSRSVPPRDVAARTPLGGGMTSGLAA
jgi:hypothetical protein